MGRPAREAWTKYYADGKDFRRLSDAERALLAQHAPVPEGGGRALDVGCGTGELAVHLASVGYAVDAVDYSDGAIARAREEHRKVEGVRWLQLDIEADDPAGLDGISNRKDTGTGAGAGYDLITLRLAYAFLRDRGRVLHALGERLREGGAVVVVTPLAASTPADRRGIALDEDEIGLLASGWQQATRLEADGCAFLVLRGPCHRNTTRLKRS
ncbi:class I SAM-dependent methyltransferase [Streptomyces racemochromogenes]|uniref:class I SAM-dependent methyltransferase n=1 Tax=Streptomyces racemochromogenes TaxID=67353 RepID=UPI0035E5C8ED